MSLSVTRKVIGLTVGVGTVVPTSWGIYNLMTTPTPETTEEIEKKEIVEETRTLKNFKSISKEQYGKGTVAGSYFGSGSAEYDYYLSTGKENKAAWEEMWDSLKDKDNSLSESYEELDEWILTSINGIKTGFDENKGDGSLNGLCEKLYKSEYKLSYDYASWYFCSSAEDDEDE